MEIISLIALAIFAILLAVTIIVIPSAMIFNLKAGLKYREKLAQQLNQLRISKMLGALGIDITEYLHQESTNDIRQQMTRCGECANTDQCDDGIAKGDISPESIAYCNNDAALREIAAKQNQSQDPKIS